SWPSRSAATTPAFRQSGPRNPKSRRESELGLTIALRIINLAGHWNARSGSCKAVTLVARLTLQQRSAMFGVPERCPRSAGGLHEYGGVLCHSKSRLAHRRSPYIKAKRC